VQAYAELGVPGGTIFVLVLLTAAGIGLRFARGRQWVARGEMHRPEYLASLVAYASGAYFLSHAYFPPLFGLLGIIALADRVIAHETKTDSDLAWTDRTTPLAVRGGRGGLANGAFQVVDGPRAIVR
jgi:hypothetical protein